MTDFLSAVRATPEVEMALVRLSSAFGRTRANPHPEVVLGENALSATLVRATLERAAEKFRESKGTLSGHPFALRKMSPDQACDFAFGFLRQLAEEVPHD